MTLPFQFFVSVRLCVVAVVPTPGDLDLRHRIHPKLHLTCFNCAKSTQTMQEPVPAADVLLLGKRQGPLAGAFAVSGGAGRVEGTDGAPDLG